MQIRAQNSDYALLLKFSPNAMLTFTYSCPI